MVDHKPHLHHGLDHNPQSSHQLVLGVPLEMVHGGLRVAAVYISGVLAGLYDDYVLVVDDDDDVHGQDNNLGSLWTSILKPGVFLSGASGGVYALITGGF